MRQPFRRLAVGLLACGLAAAAGGYGLLQSSSKADVNAELGKWLLTVAAGFVITGALSMVVRQIDQRRGERETWHGVLNDLVAANQTVMMTRVRLRAHRSAKTYQEQLGELMSARVELRRLTAMGIVIADRPLRDRISRMRYYLDELGQEYEQGYLWVSRQQRLDEAWLTARMDAAKDSTDAPALSEALARAPTAWRLLMRPARFPRLARLLDSEIFAIDAFRANYKVAKGMLESHSSFRGRTRTDLRESACKLSRRTKAFLKEHAGLPDEIRADVSSGLEAIDSECSRAHPDAEAITAATIKLNDATAAAIDTMFVATEDPSAPPQELLEPHQADQKP